MINLYLSRLQFGTVITANIDWILAREVFWSQFVIEEQTIRAEFLFGNAIFAFNIGIALSRDWISSIDVRAAGGALLVLLLRLLVLLLAELGLGPELISLLVKLSHSWNNRW